MTRELIQLQQVNHTLMDKIQTALNAKTSKTITQPMKNKLMDKGIIQILDKFSDMNLSILGNNSIKGQIEKLTYMLLSFNFDQITQLKI